MININKLLESKHIEISFPEINIDKNFVKNFRQANKLTQVALANILGVTKKTIEKWEQGINNINGSSAVLLTLLNNNPELVKQLYSVNRDVRGTEKQEKYIPIDTKVIKTSSRISKTSTFGPIAAMFF